MMSRLDFLVIVAAVASGVLLIEQRHLEFIDPPTQAELAARAAAAAICPDNDNVPYSARCISFMEGSFWSGVSGRANAAESPVPK